ncbi:MAG: hypothetical protein ACXWKB_06405 [Methyloceanibacter sp.]
MAPRGVSSIGLGAAFCLVASGLSGPGASATEPGAIEGYKWIGGTDRGTASFVYGSPETVEDLEFWLTCEPKTKKTDLTVYVDIKGTKVGQAMQIEISVG